MERLLPREDKSFCQAYTADDCQGQWGWNLGHLTQANDFFHYLLFPVETIMNFGFK